VTGRFHDTRHTLITELAESGAGDQTIMDIAGHVSRQMLSRYSHIRMEAKRRACRSRELTPAHAHVQPYRVVALFNGRRCAAHLAEKRSPLRILCRRAARFFAASLRSTHAGAFNVHDTPAKRHRSGCG